MDDFKKEEILKDLDKIGDALVDIRKGTLILLRKIQELEEYIIEDGGESNG